MSGKSALLVEDSREVMEVIREILSSYEYSVRATADGLKAWEMINAELFDLVISDLGLPGMSGEELLRNMRKKSIDSPVIITAGIDLNTNDPRWKQLTNYRIINKPFGVEEIKGLISDLISEKSSSGD